MSLSNILITIVAITVAISVHEFGHAYAAHLLGDDTAKMHGRMTLDPAKHIDPIGLITMLIFRIGWAKPVPVNPNNFKNYKIGNILVSLAGAIGNILAAIVCVLIMKYVRMEAMRDIAYMTMLYNVGFAAFNLPESNASTHNSIVITLVTLAGGNLSCAFFSYKICPLDTSISIADFEEIFIGVPLSFAKAIFIGIKTSNIATTILANFFIVVTS